jgi:hypothetical protein
LDYTITPYSRIHWLTGYALGEHPSTKNSSYRTSALLRFSFA